MTKKQEARHAGKRPNKQHGGCGVEQITATTENDYTRLWEPLEAGYTPKQAARGRMVIARARTWRRENPDAWKHAIAYATRKAAAGERISAQGIIEDLRRIDYTDVHGKPTRTNNDFAPVFARWIAGEHPQTAAYIELRRCVFDELMGGGLYG